MLWRDSGAHLGAHIAAYMGRVALSARTEAGRRQDHFDLDVKALVACPSLSVVHGNPHGVLARILQRCLPLKFTADRVDRHAAGSLFQGIVEWGIAIRVRGVDNVEKESGVIDGGRLGNDFGRRVAHLERRTGEGKTFDGSIRGPGGEADFIASARIGPGQRGAAIR